MAWRHTAHAPALRSSQFMASNRQTRAEPGQTTNETRGKAATEAGKERGGGSSPRNADRHNAKAASAAVSPTFHQRNNIDETGKDLNSLPMISGNSPSYQGFRDCARSPFARSGARFVEFADIGARQ